MILIKQIIKRPLCGSLFLFIPSYVFIAYISFVFMFCNIFAIMLLKNKK